MGYYDQPTPAELIVSFTCANEECGAEVEETDGYALDGTAWADCDKCGKQTEWELPDYDDSCHCGDYCRC